MANLDPYGTPRPCVGCEHFAQWLADGSHVLCTYGDRKQIQAQPEHGCVHWVRAIGADDEDPPPKRINKIVDINKKVD
ncbi:hypothetical protein [Paraburkholderia sp. Cpub6]|uniref:hypothetical protein n=1 Tax=Paraburkholderia sp. Cpub6 TaxID=2723094 RepID=UPI0016210E18|nr:hypothetical protein [Paraburkholderia sp. Cpub6]MBB5462851.1 hypothetical protein [Paraburkholderia sp. Cpub6]